MWRKRVYRKRRQVRKSRPRRRFSRRRSIIPRQLPTVLPNNYVCKMRYVEQFSLNPDNTGTPSYQVFKCDSLYDPNTTGVGHQPMGFDNLMGMYKKYQVLGSKIRMSPIPGDGSAITNLSAYGIATMSTANEIGGFTLDRLLENDRVTKQIRLCGSQQSLAYNLNRPNVVTSFFSAKKTYGKGYLGDTDHQGSSSADASVITYWGCFALAPQSGTDPTITYWIAQIDYIIRFTDPIMLTQS